jgi:hypothetical protein
VYKEVILFAKEFLQAQNYVCRICVDRTHFSASIKQLTQSLSAPPFSRKEHEMNQVTTAL